MLVQQLRQQQPASPLPHVGRLGQATANRAACTAPNKEEHWRTTHHFAPPLFARQPEHLLRKHQPSPRGFDHLQEASSSGGDFSSSE